MTISSSRLSPIARAKKGFVSRETSFGGSSHSEQKAGFDEQGPIPTLTAGGCWAGGGVVADKQLFGKEAPRRLGIGRMLLARGGADEKEPTSSRATGRKGSVVVNEVQVGITENEHGSVGSAPRDV